MRTKEICERCGSHIDAARLALELTLCERCAKQIPENILNDRRSARDLLGQVVDVSCVPIPWARQRDNHKFQCLFCHDAASTPDKVRHREGCLIAQIKVLLQKGPEVP